MFDWILNMPLNIIYIFFNVSTFKVDDFLNLFPTINFSYQYLNKAKAYIEPSRTSKTALFRENVFLQNLPESLFNNVTDRSLSSEVVARGVLWKRCSEIMQ